MATFRQKALDNAYAHKSERFYEEKGPVSSYFGRNVFNLSKMKDYISGSAYNSLEESIRTGTGLDLSSADEIAQGMKAWAQDMGATHYTHMFQPLTGSTAEKHESFVRIASGKVFEKFTGAALVRQEPDASSFPNGGLRNTFEARGYSAWDPTSPVFILDETLCIPSIFISYTGEALDMKTPNLKSMQALKKEAIAVARLFNNNVNDVQINLGIEQEYFLVDEALYNARPDLVQCDRTTIGHTAAKDQQLNDHYFGAIPSRVEAYMKDFETVAYKLGILICTRHNEVAPNQFECVAQYCESTKAIDQNMLLMIIMRKVAEKHHLKVIFHEKPFGGINGSGKHCNWSLQTDTGINLLAPSASETNDNDAEKKAFMRFLAFYSSIVKGIYDHHYLLMSSVASLGNSYRLGGHEAPPAIMSVFSGSTLCRVFRTIMKTKSLPKEDVNMNDGKKDVSLKVTSSIPEIFTDNTDRNRTSPFAFTGNRFEFRALGSSMNVAGATYVMNTIAAESLAEFRRNLTSYKEQGMDFETAIMNLVADNLSYAKDILFEGNGYSEQWRQEALKRGIRELDNVPDSYDVYKEEATKKLFIKHGVLSEAELNSRFEVFNETYVKKLQIEARVIGDICLNHVIPAAVSYQNILMQSIRAAKEVFEDEFKEICQADISLYKQISSYVNVLKRDCELLVEERKKANRVEDISLRAKMYSRGVKEMMDKIRYSADHLEMLVDDELWPMPKYRELFIFSS